MYYRCIEEEGFEEECEKESNDAVCSSRWNADKPSKTENVVAFARREVRCVSLPVLRLLPSPLRLSVEELRTLLIQKECFCKGRTVNTL